MKIGHGLGAKPRLDNAEDGYAWKTKLPKSLAVTHTQISPVFPSWMSCLLSMRTYHMLELPSLSLLRMVDTGVVRL
jgi:hypothetical protein